MTFVTPSDDIIVQEGTFAYSFESSGAISGGMLVKMAGPMEVIKSTGAPQDNPIGVAAYTVAKGNMVGVYGPGNIIRTYTASTMTFGDDLYCGTNSGVDDTQTLGGTFPMIGIALEDKVAAGTVKVLLK